MQQDKTIVERIIKEVADDFNITEEMVSDIHKSIWTYQRRVFSFPNYPDLLLTYWGSYKVHHTRLRRYMLKFFTLHRKGKVSTEVLRDIITRYWPIYKVVLANYYKKIEQKWRKKNE